MFHQLVIAAGLLLPIIFVLAAFWLLGFRRGVSRSSSPIVAGIEDGARAAFDLASPEVTTL